MKYEDLFSLKNNEKIFQTVSAAIKFGPLRVKYFPHFTALTAYNIPFCIITT